MARTLSEIADLLELKGDNPFKIRAYRNAADIVSHAAEQVAGLDEAALRAWNGIGKDLAGRIREIALTGDCAIRQELLTEFPETLLDVLQAAGRGPEDRGGALSGSADQEPRRSCRRGEGRTHSLVERHGRQEGAAHSPGDRRAAAPCRPSPALARDRSRRRHRRVPEGAGARRGHHHASAASGAARKPAATSTSCARRGRRHSPTHSCSIPGVERVLGHGGGKASVLMRGGFQADLRIVKPDQRGAAMQYFTGSKAHNIVLRDKALERGWKLNEYGLFDAEETPYRRRHRRRDLQGARHGVRAAELRENRGEIEAALEDAPAPPDRGYQISRVMCTCTPPSRTAANPWRPWWRRPGARAGVHRHHRSHPVAGHGQWP